eukprot:jgi/Chlat1/5202/Chrsp33S05045
MLPQFGSTALAGRNDSSQSAAVTAPNTSCYGQGLQLLSNSSEAQEAALLAASEQTTELPKTRSNGVQLQQYGSSIGADFAEDADGDDVWGDFQSARDLQQIPAVISTASQGNAVTADVEDPQLTSAQSAVQVPTLLSRRRSVSNDKPVSSTLQLDEGIADSVDPSAPNKPSPTSMPFIPQRIWNMAPSWRIRAVQRARKILVSPDVAQCFQVAAGVVFCSLFTLIPSLRYPTSCFLPIWFAIGSLLMTNERFLGAKIHAGCLYFAASLLSCTLAGVTNTIALALPIPYRPTISCLAALGLILFAALRADPSLASTAVIGTFLYGIVVQNGGQEGNIGYAWLQVAYMLLTCAIASSTVAVAGVLIFPSSSCDALRSTASGIADRLGQAVSTYASRVLYINEDCIRRDMDLVVATDEADGGFVGKIQYDWQHHVPQRVLAFDEGLEQLKVFIMFALCFHVASLRPELDRAHTCLNLCVLEPAVVAPLRARLESWRAVLNAMETLVTRLGALETVLESKDGSRRFRSITLKRWFDGDTLPQFQFGLQRLNQMASFTELQKTLSQGVLDGFNHYWEGVRTKPSGSHVISPVGEVRALFFVANVTHGIAEAVTALQSATTKVVEEGDAGVLSPTLLQTKWLSRGWQEQLGFTGPLLRTLLLFPDMARLTQVIVKSTPNTVKSAWHVKQRLRSKSFQFAVKYWIACAGTLAVALSGNPTIDNWHGIWAFVTVCIVMQSKAEATVFKGLLRIVATFLGSALGFLIMYNTALSSNPYILATLAAAITMVGVYFIDSPYRYAVYLFHETVYLVLFCQYTPVCCLTGDWQFAVSRAALIAVGSTLAVLISHLVLPWYASAVALDVLAETTLHAFAVFDAGCSAYFNMALRPEDLDKQPLLNNELDLMLMENVARPLGHVQAAQTVLARESVTWRRGVLAMPPVVRDTVQSMVVVTSRLASLSLALQRKPRLHGRYTRSAHTGFVYPLQNCFQNSIECASAMVVASSNLLRRKNGASADEVLSRITELEESRVQLRQKYIEQRRLLHNSVKDSNPQLPLQAVIEADDIVLLLIWFYAYASTLDKLTLAARTIAAYHGVLEEDWLA